MRWIPLTVAAITLALVAACGGADQPTPEGPTSLSLTKSVVDLGRGEFGREFRFTLTLTNGGEYAAVNVATSDFWEAGLAVTAIGSVKGREPKEIGDQGLEFILTEFAAGESVDLVYTARCRESGEWQNTAAAGAANADPVEDSVTVSCPFD